MNIGWEETRKLIRFILKDITEDDAVHIENELIRAKANNQHTLLLLACLGIQSAAKDNLRICAMEEYDSAHKIYGMNRRNTKAEVEAMSNLRKHMEMDEIHG